MAVHAVWSPCSGEGASLGGHRVPTLRDTSRLARTRGDTRISHHRHSMMSMFLRTRLHMYLLWSTCVFAFLAIISSLLTDGGGGSNNSSPSAVDKSSATTTSVASGPTSTYVPLQYTVQPGESLFTIAQRLNISAPALVELNKIKNPDRVDAGTVLLLPPATGFVPIGATTTMPP